MTRGFDALLCDMDGVLYRGDVAVPGAAEAVERLRRDGVQVLFCTNNSRWTAANYVEKLRRQGVRADEDDLITSARVTADQAAARGFSGRPAFVVGGEGIREALGAVGVKILEEDDEDVEAELVVVGWDPEFSYVRMRRAATFVRRGASFFATNSDATFPAADGDEWPGAGSILASIETASGRRAEVMGKPHPPMADTAVRRIRKGARVAMVGDRPDTDLALADVNGWMKILVLSGVTDAAAAARLDPPPDVVLESIADLV
ncbi:MAG TPA: HAD-IIA family hydrolase [Actinomycetota bacterium]|nr:HAD-IIA family hydrolase [Actinomycetota bacterium]